MARIISSELGHISGHIGDHIPVRRYNVYNGGGRYVCKCCSITSHVPRNPITEDE